MQNNLKQTHLLALEESFSVTVGKVQRQSHYTRSVLHPLNDPIQFSPAWTLWSNTPKGYNQPPQFLEAILPSNYTQIKHDMEEAVCHSVCYYNYELPESEMFKFYT